MNIRATIKEHLSKVLSLLVTKILVPIGVTATHATVAGFLITCLGATFILRDSLVAAGCILLFGASLDMLDGIIARTTGSASNRGALLDSIADRISEAIIFLCIVSHYLVSAEDSTDSINPQVLWTCTALVTSLMVSYLRAKGESLGVSSSIGWITRPERMILVVVGLIASHWYPDSLFICIQVIAVGSMIVSGQRFKAIWQDNHKP